MSAQKGKELLLQVDDGAGGYATVGGFKTNNFSIDGQAIDVTTKDSNGFKEYLDGGINVSIITDATGVFMDDVTRISKLEGAVSIPIIGTILDAIKGPLDKLIPDKNARLKFNHELEMEMLRAGLAQLEINKAEAQHPSVFVAGWRPFVGWTCGASLAWHFIGYDLLNWLRLAFFADMLEPPALNGTETLVTVLMAMLGLGGLRTVEKLKGVGRDGWRGK